MDGPDEPDTPVKTSSEPEGQPMDGPDEQNTPVKTSSEPEGQPMDGPDEQDTPVKTLSELEGQPMDRPDEQDTPVKTSSELEDQPMEPDSKAQPLEVDEKEFQPKHEEEQQEGSEQQQVQVVETKQATRERDSEEKVSNEIDKGEVKPRPLMEMKPTSDYFSASDATKEEEEVSMVTENNADVNVDPSVNADSAKEVSLCVYSVGLSNSGRGHGEVLSPSILPCSRENIKHVVTVHSSGVGSREVI